MVKLIANVNYQINEYTAVSMAGVAVLLFCNFAFGKFIFLRFDIIWCMIGIGIRGNKVLK